MRERNRRFFGESPKKGFARVILAATLLAGQDASFGQSYTIPEEKNGQETVRVIKELSPHQVLQSALNLNPHSVERKRLELQYLGMIATDPKLEEIDKGFWVSVNPSVRAQLLDMRWELRKEGKSGLIPVPEDKIAWAQANKFHPEILGLALDSYEEAREIINELHKNGKLRDEAEKTVFTSLDEPMMNPGGMAALIHYETSDIHHFSRYAFTNIGGGLALEQLNSKVFPTGKEDLEKLCLIMSEKTGLIFRPENIPGSLWQNPANDGESGGAIPPIQFMPSNSLKFYNLAKEAGYDLNAFDLKDSIKMAWIFLARHENVGVGFRVGYRKGILKDQQNALLKWNYDGNILRVLDVATDYYTRFLDPVVNEKPYPY